jgi:hypothetical protein
MSTATNAVVENRMEPVAKAVPVPHLTVTGQGLYDRFIKPDSADVSRMTAIRELVHSADALAMAGSTDKMVELARAADLADGVPEKEMRDGKERRTRGPKEANAMNVRTIIRQVWGALKFTAAGTGSYGMTDDTGWLAAAKIAKTALAAAQIDWKNEALKTDADKARAKLQAATKAETKALTDVQKDNPRANDETLEAWNERVMKMARNSMETARAEAIAKVVTALVDGIYNKHGVDIALAVAGEIAKREGVDITLTVEGEEEMTEEQADAALAEAGEVEAAELAEALNQE